MALVALTAGVVAQSSVQLADPQRSVFTAFAEADGFRAIVRTVDVAERRTIEAGLPFRVHFNEIGPHWLYVALRGRLPLGLVYARREESAWGLIDLEWALTLDLRLAGFRFERARTTSPPPSPGSEFGRCLIGKGREQLVDLLDDQGSLRPSTPGILPDARELATLTVRSALKAIVVAETVWPRELAKLRDHALGLRAFPGAVGFERLWPPPGGDPGQKGAVGASEVRSVVRASDPNGVIAGTVAETGAAADGESVTLCWIVGANGDVVDVVVTAGRPSAARRASCSDCRGSSLAAIAAGDAWLADIAKHLLAVLAAAPAAHRP